MHALGIEINAACDVAGERVIGEAVPEASDNVVELAGAVIALFMFHMLVQPEIERRIRIGGGDDVPACAPAADVVERGEPAGDVVGLIEGSRGRGDEPNV